VSGHVREVATMHKAPFGMGHSGTNANAMGCLFVLRLKSQRLPYQAISHFQHQPTSHRTTIECARATQINKAMPER